MRQAGGGAIVPAGMSPDPALACRAIARKLAFYVQLAARPEAQAAHVAEIVRKDHGHTREELLVAVDWALSQPDVGAIVGRAHGDEVLRRYFTAVVEHLV